MTCELVTGSAGADHVSSADDGSMFASVFGPGRYAVKQGNDLAATLASSNSVQIGTGACFIDGRYFRVTAAETVSFDSGAQGVNRIDLIGVKYTYNSGTGVETGELAVVKGTATSGTPSAPTYTDGDITEGAAQAFFPLYSITLTGITPGDPVKMFHMMQGTVSCPWPVGSVLQMTNATNPNDVYPGTTWQEIQGMFLLGSSSSYSLGSTGGSSTVTLTTNNMPQHAHSYTKATGGTVASHTLTINQIPSHTHTEMRFNNEGSGSNWGANSTNGKYKMESGYIGNTGGGQGHNHGFTLSTTSANSGNAGQASPTAVNKMPPYKVVNMWERVA